MGDDCDAGGLEDPVQRLNRVLFAALSTASSLRLAAFAQEAGPPGYTHRPAQNLTSRHQSHGHAGQDDI